jgi:hypothetical protein
MCRIPTFSQPDCTPDGGTPTNPNFQYFSGWTSDGLALDEISIALNLTTKIWPYVSPCSVYAAAVGPAGAGGAAAAEAAFLSAHGFSCKEVAVPDGIPGLQLRVAALDFTALVANGKIPVDKLRLVPEVALLEYLERFRAEGYTMQQSERAVISGLSLSYAHCACS